MAISTQYINPKRIIQGAAPSGAAYEVRDLQNNPYYAYHNPYMPHSQPAISYYTQPYGGGNAAMSGGQQPSYYRFTDQNAMARQGIGTPGNVQALSQTYNTGFSSPNQLYAKPVAGGGRAPTLNPYQPMLGGGSYSPYGAGTGNPYGGTVYSPYGGPPLQYYQEGGSGPGKQSWAELQAGTQTGEPSSDPRQASAYGQIPTTMDPRSWLALPQFDILNRMAMQRYMQPKTISPGLQAYREAVDAVPGTYTPSPQASRVGQLYQQRVDRPDAYGDIAKQLEDYVAGRYRDRPQTELERTIYDQTLGNLKTGLGEIERGMLANVERERKRQEDILGASLALTGAYGSGAEGIRRSEEIAEPYLAARRDVRRQIYDLGTQARQEAQGLVSEQDARRLADIDMQRRALQDVQSLREVQEAQQMADLAGLSDFEKEQYTRMVSQRERALDRKEQLARLEEDARAQGDTQEATRFAAMQELLDSYLNQIIQAEAVVRGNTPQPREKSSSIGDFASLGSMLGKAFKF